MVLLIPVLVKDESWKEHKNKLFEESIELLDELATENVENTVSEAFDVIQVCIGILDKAWKENPDILQQKNGEHISKLINKGWKFSSVLRLEED